MNAPNIFNTELIIDEEGIKDKLKSLDVNTLKGLTDKLKDYSSNAVRLILINDIMQSIGISTEVELFLKLLKETILEKINENPVTKKKGVKKILRKLPLIMLTGYNMQIETEPMGGGRYRTQASANWDVVILIKRIMYDLGVKIKQETFVNLLREVIREKVRGEVPIETVEEG